jgi:hypothetical protein
VGQGALDAAHHLDLDRALVAQKLFALQLPDAVFCTDAAAELMHQIINDAVDGGCAAMKAAFSPAAAFDWL